MKLAVKLSLTLGVLFCCIATVGLFGLYQMNKINAIATDISQTHLPSIINIQGLNILTSTFRRYETEHIHSETPTIMLFYERKMQQVREAIDARLEVYKNSLATAEEKELYQSIVTRWNHYLTLSTEATMLSKALQTHEAIFLLDNESLRQYQIMVSTLVKAAELDVSMGKAASQAGTALYTDATRLVMFMLIATLLLAAGLGGYLVRDTLRTLGKDPSDLGALARRIADGDLDVQTDERAVGVYADMLVMVDNLRQHLESIETLTANIPGGVLSCIADESCTLLYASDGFLTLTGYSREELATRFQNQFARIIDPADQERAHATLLNQLLAGDTFELEYAILHKDGHLVRVLDRGRRVFDKTGQAHLYSVLSDITSLKNAQRQLSFQEERCRAALCATHDFVFVSDSDSFTFSKGVDAWADRVGPIPANYVEVYTQGLALCHPDDASAFCNAFAPERIASMGDAQGVCLEYRFRSCQNNQYWWFRSTVVPFLDMNGHIVKLYGCIVDINRRKQEERKILQVAQRDSLTGLYNKGFVEEAITNFLSGPESSTTHALLILDIDSFKSINDNLGHLFGDAVLTDISALIRKTFRSSDIIGRIGGDEFIILLKDVQTDPALLTTKAQALCAALQRSFSGEDRDYTISASVGIARFPQDGVCYRELFRKADMALYTAKNQGKNQYCYYTEAVEANGYGCNVSQTGLTDIAERSTNRSFRDDVLSYIFELLYEAKDIGSIITIALGIIGKHYGVSRAYVFQNAPDNLSCSNTHEWCNDGISSQQEQLQNIHYAQTGNYLASYTQDGVFYCDDTEKLRETDPQLYGLLIKQGIKSLLDLAIFDEGHFRGYIGFDECNAKRLWTKDEIETLTTLAKMLGVFLVKKNISRQLIQSYANITAILDSLDVWAYVIDSENDELLYVNAKTRELAPQTRVGEKCYASFFAGRTIPCSICPKTGLDAKNKRCTLEIYNQTFDLWSLATASRIPWSDGKEAVLLCCVDVSQYKRASGEGRANS